MKEYDVKITEILEKTVTEDAQSREEAEERVRTAYYRGEHILDADSFVGVEFGTLSEHEASRKNIEEDEIEL